MTPLLAAGTAKLAPRLGLVCVAVVEGKAARQSYHTDTCEMMAWSRLRLPLRCRCLLLGDGMEYWWRYSWW